MNEPTLFDPGRIVAQACPVGGCQAIRLPGQDRVPTCRHDLEPEGKRPKSCLNTYRQEDAEIPF